MAVETHLLQVIGLLYHWQPDEIQSLAADLLERRQSIWIQVLRVRAQEHGCNKVPISARREDLAELRRMSNEDARSIGATWNSDVDREVQRLFNSNPRGNRQYYISNLERYAARRGAWKNLQIGLYTEQSTAFYTNNRFRQMNGLRGQRYIYVGPPPVGEECIRRFAAGVVDEGYVQTHQTPAHPNCPHRYASVNPIQVDDCEELWLG